MARRRSFVKRTNKKKTRRNRNRNATKNRTKNRTKRINQKGGVKILATLAGHGSSVNSVAFHPRLPLLATGSSDKTVKICRLSFNLDSVFSETTLKEHSGSVNSVAFHPTAPLLATGCSDNTVRLWSFSVEWFFPPEIPASAEQPPPSTLVATLEGHIRPVLSVAFHPTAPLLATGSVDMTARLWLLSSDNSSATCVATLKGHSSSVYSVAFHRTAPLLATGSDDETVRLWLLSSDNLSATSERPMEATATLAGHSRPVTSVAFHPTAPLLATGSWDKTVRLWRFSPDGSTADCVATLAGGSMVNSVAFHPTAPLLATGSGDHTVRLWRFSPEDPSDAACVANLAGHSGSVNSVVFHPTAPLLATGSLDYTVRLWNYDDHHRNPDENPSCGVNAAGRSGPNS